jgi:hypothetical protein
MTDDNQSRKEDANPLALWIAIGLTMGAGTGVALDNLILGVGVGITLGVAVGLTQSQRRDQE